jgi:Trk K+ transport system NAD-binding subunit
MKQATLGDKLRYRFDNLMSRGTIALVGMLFVITLAMVLVATFILVLARIRLGGAAEPLSLGEAFWQTMMRAIDTGTTAGDTGWSGRLVGFGITLGGIFIASALIGVLASGLEGRLDDLRRGRSRVIETGHTVILGWSPQVFTIISELAFANRNFRESPAGRKQRGTAVVILAEKDKVEMEEEIRTKVPNTMGMHVVCRSGSPLDLDDLQIVSPDTARAIIVVSPGGETPDLPVIKTMVALVRNRDKRQSRYHIVAAIHRPANIEVARMIGGDEADVFMVDRLVSRLIAQTCRQSGLSVVYAELLSFEGAAIYCHEEPALAGVPYSQALSRYEDSALVGLRTRDGRVQLSPPMDTTIQPGDQVIAIARDAAAIRLSDRTDYAINMEAIYSGRSSVNPLERLLILGWNRRGPMILEQIAYYVPSGSQVLVVAPYDTEQMRADCAAAQLQQMHVTFEQGNYADRSTLERLLAGGHQYVVILSRTDLPDIQIADAHAMLALFHLRDIMGKSGRSLPIVSEILDVRNRDLAEVSSAEDVVISERLVALALAQIAENRDIVPVLVDLLNPGGVEIYLKPARDYIMPGQPVNFYTVVEAALRRGETAIGYRLLAEASAPERSFGVHLNPDKSAIVAFGDADRVIVLAEE